MLQDAFACSTPNGNKSQNNETIYIAGEHRKQETGIMRVIANIS